MYKFVSNNCLCYMQIRQSQTEYYSAVRYEKFEIEYQGFLLRICTHRNEFNHVLGSKQLRKYTIRSLSVVPRSRFKGDTGVPLPEFQGDIHKFWRTRQIFQIFTCKIEFLCGNLCSFFISI